MKDWQQRVIDEKNDLVTKGNALSEFLDTDVFDTLDSDGKAWLVIQAHAMELYANALAHRIARFEK